MSHARGLVTFGSNCVTFRWSDGARFFEPYHLADALWDRFAQCNEQTKAALRESASAAALARAGYDLMESIFPSEHAQCAEIRNWLATFIDTQPLEIATNRPGFVPWNAVYDQTPHDEAQWSGDDSPEWNGFWGQRFELVAGSVVHAMRKIPVLRSPDILLVIDPGARDALENAHKDRLNSFLESRGVTFADSKASLQTEIQDLQPELIYFWGRADDDGFFFGAEHLSWRQLEGLLKKRDNAEQAQLFPNWFTDGANADAHAAFRTAVSASATMLAGCDVSLSPSASFAFGLDVLDELFDNEQPFRTAFRNIRDRHKLTGMCYGVYAPAQARLSWQEDAAADENEYELPEEPYRPLSPYDRNDRPLLCERDNEVMHLCRLLDDEQTQTVVLHGAACAGKKSLVRGGVIPLLEDDCFGYRFLYDRSGDDFDENNAIYLPIRATNDLASQLANALAGFCSALYRYSTPTEQSVEVDLPGILQRHLRAEPDSTAIQAQSNVEGVTTAVDAADTEEEEDDAALAIWQNIRTEPAFLAQLLCDICSQLPFLLVVLIENLEEVFSQFAQPGDAHQDLAALAELSMRTDGCKVVVTINSEFLGRLYDEIPPAKFPQWQTLHVGLPSRMQLLRTMLLPTSKDAVLHGNEIPFEKYNFQFEEDAPEHLLALAEEAAQHQHVHLLPVVQIACAYLYVTVKDRDDKVIRQSDINRLGDLAQLLQHYVDAAIKQLGIARSDRWMVPILIQDLTSFEENGAVLRRYENYDELLANKWSDIDSFATVVEQLSAMEVAVFEQHTQYSDDGEFETLSLGRDSLPQLGGQLQALDRQRKYFRARMIDVLWIALPLVFLLIVITFVLTRRYARGDMGLDRKLVEKTIGKFEKHIKEQRSDLKILLGQLKRINLNRRFLQAKLAWETGDILRMRKLLQSYQKNSETPDQRNFEWWYLWRLANSERHKFLGHRGDLTSVAVSADDKWIASASTDGAVKLWDAQSGNILVDLLGLNSAVHQIAFSKDSQWLAAAAEDKKIYLWKLDKIGPDHQKIAKPAKTFAEHDDAVTQVAFVSDSQFVSTGKDKKIIFWDLTKDKSTKTVNDHAHPIVAAAVSQSGELLATADDSGKVNWRDIKANKTATIDFAGKVTSLAFSPGETKLAMGGTTGGGAITTGVAQLVDLKTGTFAKRNYRHSTKIYAVQFGAESSLFTAGHDNTVRKWNVATGKSDYVIKGHVGSVTTLAMSHQSDWLVTGSSDRKVKVWPKEKDADNVLQHSKAIVSHVAFFADNKLLVSADRERTIKIWDSESNKLLHTIGKLPAGIRALAVSPKKGEYRVAAALGDAKQAGQIIVWKLEQDAEKAWTSTQEMTLKEHKSAINALAWSPDGKQLASGGDDKRIVLWDLAKKKSTHILDKHQNPIAALTFALMGGDLILASTAKGDARNLKFWFADSGKQKGPSFPNQTKLQHTSTIHDFAILPDHRVVLTASADRTIRLWSWSGFGTRKNGKVLLMLYKPNPVQTFRAHTDAVVSVTSHLASRMFISGSSDGTVRLWDLDRFAERFTLVGHNAAVHAIAMSPNGETIASGDTSGVIRLWRSGPHSLGVEHK